jgi:hypothetical protein
MRSSWNLLVAVAAGLMLAPQLATASDVEEQLRQMQERMAQLEDKLQAQDDQLNAAEQRVEEQQRVIEDAGLNEESAGSALSRFLEQTEFSGVVAASWGWNFNNPKAPTMAGLNNPAGVRGTGVTNSGLNTGIFGLTNPFHQNTNTFQLDQLLFSMMKPATVESRGGFGVDLAYGASADALRNSGCADFDDIFGCTGSGNSGDLSFLYQAYAEYLAPIGNGMLVKGGRFETIVGSEVFRADENYNITRGLLYAMQPTSHTGLMLSGEVTSGVSLGGGIVNGYSNTMADSDQTKTFLAQIAWAGETAGLGFNVVTGGDVVNPLILLPAGVGVGKNSDRVTLFDVVASWDPSDNLGMWLNFDYWMPVKDGVAGTGNTDYWGIGAAGRYGVTDAVGVALRGEYVFGNNAAVVCCGGGGGDGGHVQLIELTGTVDFALTDNLKVLGEVRWDKGMLEGTANDVFINGGAFVKSNQIQAMLQMLYSF